MADSFNVETAREAIVTVGGTDTRDVVEAWIVTVPSGIRFPLRIPDSQWSSAQVQALGGQYSETLERWVADPRIASIYYEQDTNAAGDLTDNLVFVIQSRSGNLTRELRQPLSIVLLGNIDSIIGPPVAELDEIERL